MKISDEKDIRILFTRWKCRRISLESWQATRVLASREQSQGSDRSICLGHKARHCCSLIHTAGSTVSGCWPLDSQLTLPPLLPRMISQYPFIFVSLPTASDSLAETKESSRPNPICLHLGFLILKVGTLVSIHNSATVRIKLGNREYDSSCALCCFHSYFESSGHKFFRTSKVAMYAFILILIVAISIMGFYSLSSCHFVTFCPLYFLFCLPSRFP